MIAREATRGLGMLFVTANQMTGPASDPAWTFAFVEGELLVPGNDVDSLRPTRQDAWTAGTAPGHYLGRLSSVDCWARELAQAPPGWQRVPLRAAMMALEPALAAVAGRAAQVLAWDRTHRFCGSCGSLTVIRPGERARVCE